VTTGSVSERGGRAGVFASHAGAELTIIYATGFHVADSLRALAVTGRGGVELSQAWKGGMEARPQRDFNEWLQPRLQRTVWGSGCHSWYLNSDGKNVTLWPGFSFEFWLRTRLLNEAVLEFDPSLEQTGSLPHAATAAPRALAGRDASRQRWEGADL
jgi:hypothetical protein